MKKVIPRRFKEPVLFIYPKLLPLLQNRFYTWQRKLIRFGLYRSWLIYRVKTNQPVSLIYISENPEAFEVA